MPEKIEKVLIPDIGGASNVDVIEIHVTTGKKIAVDDPLITLESEKASIDIPSPYAGVITEIKVKKGDKVSEGDLILLVKTEGAAETAPQKSEKESAAEKPASIPAEKTEQKVPATTHEKPSTAATEEDLDAGDIHAGPGVRRIAHEFGINLTKIKGTGEKGRVTKEDVQAYVKKQLQIAESGGGGLGINIIPLPKIDFSKFGEIEKQALTKIKKFSGANLHRNWVSIPHVTQFAETDIGEMETFRKEHQNEAIVQGFKLTPIVFIMKAVVMALKKYPLFNASLDDNGENIILKKYFHLGVAVDTPNGLVVPVIRDVDKKSLFQLAKELADISKKAREKGLSVTEMQGGCFTISSLGGIGGTAFTPIINAPEVAILGVSKSMMKPVYDAETQQFIARLMLPLSLSYDHRVIDGAEGARFIEYLSACLSDVRTLLL